MTSKKRRQWARVFVGARHYGLGTWAILFFAIECVRRLLSLEPLLVALHVLSRRPRTRGRRVPASWHVPPVWAPRLLGALALGIVLWGMLAPHPNPIRIDPQPEWPVPENVTIEWLSRDGGVIAVPIPPKRLARQQAPPCVPGASGEEEINGGCWITVNRQPPCGLFYEHAGKCYIPLPETPRPPTSAGP